MGYGDTLLLVGAVGWALHILAIDHYAPRAAPLLLSLGQFIVYGCLAMVVSVFIETTSWEQVQQLPTYSFTPALLRLESRIPCK